MAMTPLTAGAARDAIAAKYPDYVKPGPMVTKVLPTRELVEQACGKGAGACAHMGSSTVSLPTNPSASLVNHETLHALTSPKWGDRVPRTVNESVTEYFNRKMGYFAPGGFVSKKAYEGGQPLLDRYIAAKPGREDALAKAYFTGDFSALEALEDRPTFGRAAPGDVLNSRLAQWDSLLKNRRPGASVTIDDEDLPKPPEPPVLRVVPGI